MGLITADLGLLVTAGGFALAFVFGQWRSGFLDPVAPTRPSAAALGLIIVLAWYLTGHLGHGENPETTLRCAMPTSLNSRKVVQ